MDRDSLTIGLNRDSRRLQDRMEEAGDILAAADGGAHIAQFLSYRFRAKGCWAKRERLAFSRLGILPFGVQGFFLGFKFSMKGRASCWNARSFFLEKSPFEQRFGNLLA